MHSRVIEWKNVSAGIGHDSTATLLLNLELYWTTAKLLPTDAVDKLRQCQAQNYHRHATGC